MLILLKNLKLHLNLFQNQKSVYYHQIRAKKQQNKQNKTKEKQRKKIAKTDNENYPKEA